MAAKTNPQLNLPHGWSDPNVSLTEQTQVEAIAALANLILQVWEMNGPMDNPSEDRIDE